VRISELIEQEKAILKQLGKDPTEEQQEHVRLPLMAVQYEVGLLLDRDIKPACIREALVSIAGLETEDGPITDAEQLLAAATPDMDGLMEEIFDACNEGSGMSGEEEKNSGSLTTSTVAVGSELPATEPVPAG
jgi:hypothetical protein